MPLVHRNGRPYYYKPSREGGRVVCHYEGSGEVAVLMSRWYAMEGVQRDTEVSEARVERDELEAAEKPLAE
jgi:hypothetical protein